MGGRFDEWYCSGVFFLAGRDFFERIDESLNGFRY